MLLTEVAMANRAKIEELYSEHAWSAVRNRAEDLARETQMFLDRGGIPRLDYVAELCEAVLRVQRDAQEKSWTELESAVKKLAHEAAQAELGARKNR